MDSTEAFSRLTQPEGLLSDVARQVGLGLAISALAITFLLKDNDAENYKDRAEETDEILKNAGVNEAGRKKVAENNAEVVERLEGGARDADTS